MKSKVLIFIFLIVLLFSNCEGDNDNGGGGEGGGGEGGGGGGGKTVTSNELGSYDGYDYEFWKNNNASGKMTVGNKGTFSCEWTSNGAGSNILFRSGRRFSATQTFRQVGDITFNYSASYSPAGTSYLSVYGWTRSPLVEYYIVENYQNGHPGMWNSPTSYGSFKIEGEGTYNIYKTQMNNAPSIDGNGKSFPQYISVRTERRTSGTISVTEHFKAWEKAGLDMSGKLYESMMKVEGYQSSGSAKITKNTLTIK